MPRNDWTEDEAALMRKHYPTRGATGLLLMVKRTRKAINLHAGKLRLTFDPSWSDEHKALLREHYAAKGSAHVAGLVGRSEFAVRAKAIDMGVKGDRYRKKGPRKNRPASGLVLRKSGPAPKAKPGLTGEPIITSETRVTIAPPFIDRRWLADVVSQVVDAAECREWARAAA